MASVVYVQLQQDPVRVAVNESLLALLREVCLEGADSLGVVSLEPIYYLGDLRRPFLWIFVVAVAHDGQLFGGCARGGGGRRLQDGPRDEVGRGRRKEEVE